MTKIALMESENSANIGSIARVMANFGFKELILINPQVDHLNSDAIRLAKHAGNILKKAKIMSFDDLFRKFDYVVATTSICGTDYNIPRIPLAPDVLREKLPKNSVIIFGRDGSGLHNDEIMRCNVSVSIPTDRKYAAMNISHAVAIILYELTKEKKGKINDHIKPASQKERELILANVNALLENMPFATKEKRETQRVVWDRLVNKSFLSKREAFALLGFFRKLDK